MLSEEIVKKLTINNGKHNAKDQRKPKCSPTNPKIGGARRKITNTNCANDATFSSGVLSLLCAAAVSYTHLTLPTTPYV